MAPKRHFRRPRAESLNLRGTILDNPTLLAPISSSPWWPRPHKLETCRLYSSRGGDALPQPRYVHDGVQVAHTRTRGAGVAEDRTRHGRRRARARAVQRSAAQRSKRVFMQPVASSCWGSEDGSGVRILS